MLVQMIITIVHKKQSFYNSQESGHFNILI